MPDGPAKWAPCCGLAETPLWCDHTLRRILSFMSFSSFVRELRRRHVIRMAIGYALVAFVVAEVADIFFPALNLPAWTVTLVVAVLILGFPVAVVLAWALEVTPEGLVRDSGPSTEQIPSGASAPGAPGSTEREGSAAGTVVPDSEALPQPSSGRDPAADIPKRSIAVLAFTDMSRDGDQEYLGDGIAEEIIDALTKLQALHVAARTSSFRFKDGSEDVREIARRLGVASVLEGSVRKAGNRLRITAQLVSVSDGYHLWSERYDRELDDVFAIQDEIARAVVEALRVELLGPAVERLVHTTTDDAEAYDQYLKGRHAWRRRYQLGLDAAMQHFRRAIERDPDFAEPYAGIADTYAVMGIYAFGDPDELRESATESVRRALSSGSDVADVQFSAGLYELVFRWSVPEAIVHFREAIRLGGRHPRARAWLGVALACQGRPEAAHAESKGALEEAPDSTYLMALHGLVCTGARKTDEARASLERVLAQDPTDLIARYVLGMLESFTGRHDRAVGLLTYVYEHGQAPSFATQLAGALARGGRRVEADRLMQTVSASMGGKIVKTAALPLFHAWAGEPDEAFEALERCVAVKAPGVLASLWMPAYDKMREDPRWTIVEPYLEGE